MSAVTNYFQFRSKSIVQYLHFERSENYSRSFRQVESANNLKTFVDGTNEEQKKTYSGELCPGAKKRLTKAIENIVMLAQPKEHNFISKRSGQERTIKFDLNFITLTVHSPDRMIKGKEGHNVLLEPFLLWMKRHHNLNLYVWKAELQKRGQLHYHITSDTFIDRHELWLKWGELNDKAGYLTEWWKKHKRTKINQYGEILPNYPVAGTDVHSVYKIRNTAQYLKKCIFKEYDIRGEMAKDNPDKISIEGKVWDCSLTLKAATYYKTDGGTGTENYIKQAEARGEARKSYADEHCTIYEFLRPAKLVMSQYDRLLYNEHITRIKNYVRKAPRKSEKLSKADIAEQLEILNGLNPLPEVIPEVKKNLKKKLTKINFKVIPIKFLPN